MSQFPQNEHGFVHPHPISTKTNFRSALQQPPKKAQRSPGYHPRQRRRRGHTVPFETRHVRNYRMTGLHSPENQVSQPLPMRAATLAPIDPVSQSMTAYPHTQIERCIPNHLTIPAAIHRDPMTRRSNHTYITASALGAKESKNHAYPAYSPREKTRC